ncbi:unnamed protein product [Menidia menidia]|uniref:(Atlantic silverside) hypothetical protein n=1 Tax=Menidia menidia TaxID=238744 RepID=A0A8S4AFE3_9TELE|nr:unnamed protein product [Menidia menidia]
MHTIRPPIPLPWEDGGSVEAVEDLKACLETTDWDVFRTATTSLDEYTETVTSYISFCEDCCIPSRTRVSYNNDKPWFSPKLRQLRLQKEEAFRSGDRDRFKESKYRFSKAVRDAKRLYSENLKKQFSANDSASVWKGLRQITNYKPKPPHSVNDLRLANELNDFYCRFERQWDSPNTNTIPRHHQPLPSCTPIPTSAGACPHPQLPTLKDPLPKDIVDLSSLDFSIPSVVLQLDPCTQGNCLTTEGLYRVSGNKTDQDNIQKQFDQDHNIDFVAMDVAVNAAAGALKAFFADLPDPLIPYSLHPELVEAAKIVDYIERLQVLQEIVKKFPPVNYQVFKYIITHLNRVSQHSKTTLMTADNLSICFWPTLMRPDFENKETLSTTKLNQAVIETFIVQSDYFFHGGEVAESSSSEGTPPPHCHNMVEALLPLQLPPPLQPQQIQHTLPPDPLI